MRRQCEGQRGHAFNPAPRMREVEDIGRRAQSREHELKHWARELDMATTGGSDCHGPGTPHRAVGACSISRAELQAVREKCSAANIAR